MYERLAKRLMGFEHMRLRLVMMSNGGNSDDFGLGEGGIALLYFFARVIVENLLDDGGLYISW